MKPRNSKIVAILKATEVLASVSPHDVRVDGPLDRRPVASNFLRISQAAHLANMSASVLRRWIREGRVPAFRFGRSGYRVRLSDILRPITPPAPKGDQQRGTR